MDALVSIVVPVYNTEKYVAETINSVISQTYTNWELILVDDCSTDLSFGICNSFSQKDPRIKALRLAKNSGALAARNKGIELSKGKFLCFLDSDDTFEPNKLEIQVKFMQKFGHAVSFTMFQRITESGEFLGKSNVPFNTKIGYKDLLGNPAFSIITLMVDKEKVMVPLVQEDLVKAEDYVFHLRILKQGVDAFGINQPLSNYRYRPGSQSTSFFGNSADLWKVLSTVEKLPIHKASFYFGRYLVKGIGKRLTLFKQVISKKG